MSEGDVDKVTGTLMPLASLRVKSLEMRATESGRFPQRESVMCAKMRGESWHHSLFQKPVY